MTRRLNISDVQKLAISKGGRLLSTEYKNAKQVLVWRCSRNHIFKSNQSNIQSGNNWCGVCTNIQRLETVIKIAKKNDLKCLSKEYLGTDKKLKWKCSKGHIILRSPEEIRGQRGCAKCYGNYPLSIDECKEIAISKGGKCLSKKYKSRKNLKWQCAEGHIWMAPGVRIKSGAWCKKCASNKPLTIEEMQKIAEERGGKCLSKKYKNYNTLLKWQCSKGHIWKAKPGNVKLKTWCPTCGGSEKLSLTKIKKYAVKKNGKCLSKTYEIITKKLKWECAEGHIWYATAASIIHRNSWCPKCHFYLSEEICRTVFEQIFKTKFPKRWIPWLVNKKGNKMELDGFSKRLKIGFEYHGAQHFKLGFHMKSKEILQTRILDDKEKLRLCRKNKVKLFIITYKDDLMKLPEIIKHKAKKLNIVNKKFDYDKKINFDKVYSNSTQIEILNKIAQKKGGKCLSKKYLGAHNHLEFKCSKGHVWKITPSHVKMGKWCRKCAGTSKLSIEEMQKLAENKGGKCLSKKYEGNRKNLKWQCAEGHIWFARPYSIKLYGSWCRKCYHLSRRRSHDVQQTYS